MHPLFQVVERRGIKENRVAAVMGVSTPYYCLVKLGKRTASPRFRRLAVVAMALLEQRREDGEEFTEADLFLAQSYAQMNEIQEHEHERVVVNA